MVTLTTDEHFKICYDLSKQFMEDPDFSAEQAAKQLIEKCGFEENEPEPINATLDLMRILSRLVRGVKLTLPRSQDYIHFCLNKIHLEEDREWLESALTAVDETIKHQYSIGGSRTVKLRDSHNELSRAMNLSPIFEDNSPHQRIGGESGESVDNRFSWTSIYETVAENLLDYEDDQGALFDIFKTAEVTIHDKVIPHKAMCPFSFISLFNKNMRTDSREKLIKELGEKFKTFAEDATANADFESAPIRPEGKTYFLETIEYQRKRPRQIERNWDFFSTAIKFAKGECEESDFVEAYDNAPKVYWVGSSLPMNKNELTIGLHWIRPWDYPNLDEPEQKYIKDKFGIDTKLEGSEKIDEKLTIEGYCNAKNYLEVRYKLLEAFKDENCPIRSFPELSWLARKSDKFGKQNAIPNKLNGNGKNNYNGYRAIDKIINEGCFVKDPDLNNMLERLKEKKNLILQGPPGTGKTWLAKRLAYALMEDARQADIEEKEKRKNIEVVQFHPNMSYEDFVKGYRPSAKAGKTLDLMDGPFMQIRKKATAEGVDEEKDVFVMVIEEINRGNPVQIFGELLTLLEADKRDTEERIRLCYGDEEIYLPKNLHVIGTMNLADRSLAIADFAFRRRFAFFDMKSIFDEKNSGSDYGCGKWREAVNKNCAVDGNEIDAVLSDIETRMKSINEVIRKDDMLGEQFCIGHSYAMPLKKYDRNGEIKKWTASDLKTWFNEAVDSGIIPLLKEYWFEEPSKIEEAENILKND